MSALIIIDLQEDFINGSLAVGEANEVIEPILGLLDFNWDAVIATKDWHPADHTSFASNHTNVKPFDVIDFPNPDKSLSTKTMPNTAWPVHCVQDTKGAQLDPHFEHKLNSLLPPTETHTVLKGYLKDREYYSCFTDVWKSHSTELKDYLQKRGIRKVVFVGLAYDYCVLNSAIDAASLGFYSYVIKSCCKSVYPDREKQTDDKYKVGGVQLISVDELHSMGLDVPITNC